MEMVSILVIVAVITVLLFDYTNGFHDAANIIATVIASRAMTPAQAVMIVATFEFLGPLLGGTAVANTIGGFVKLDDLPRITALTVVLSGLLGAIGWNLITWWRGIPSSSSHALVGGLIGAVLLALGRALGETIAVTMVIGNAEGIPSSLFLPGQTIASKIANNIGETSGEIPLASMTALALALFLLSFLISLAVRISLRRFSRVRAVS